VRIARDGYSASLRQPVTEAGDPHHLYSPWGFFPGYPLVIRAVHEVTRLPYPAAALLVGAVCGFLAVWAVYALGAAYAGEGAGRGAALLVAFFPGSAALSWPYSDGLFVAAAAAGLTALHRRRWLLAGLCGAAATLTRPTGAALVAAAGVAALAELVRRRDPKPLVAPVLAALGGVAFVLFGWWRTGDPQVWRHAENLWNQRLDVGRDLYVKVQPLLADPGTAWRTHEGTVNLVMAYVDIVGLLLLAVLVAAAVANRTRLTAPMVVYAAVVVFTIVGYSAVGPRPRMVLAVVPGFVWLAARLPRRAVVALVALFLPLLVAVTCTWLWSSVTP
jgi:Dolichyl-phosphate-mannose-protein mannosyltransferase